MGKTGNSQEELLKSTLAAIEKEYGKGSIMTLGSRERVSIDVISSGSLALDRALGIGGYPKGRVIEIFGPESSGKTTTALHNKQFGLKPRHFSVGFTFLYWNSIDIVL